MDTSRLSASEKAALAAAQEILGEKTIEMFDALHQANRSSRTPAELFVRAIKSVYKSEQERLDGKLRTYMAKNNVSPETAKKVYFACGLLNDGREDPFSRFVAEGFVAEKEQHKTKNL